MLPALSPPSGRRSMTTRAPRPPRGSARGRGAKGAADAASTTSRLHQAAQAAMIADEERVYAELIEAEAAAFTSITQDATFAVLANRSSAAESSIAALTTLATTTEASATKTETTMISVCAELRALSARVSTMMDTRDQLDGTGQGSAEVRASVAERTVRDLTLDVEQLKGENEQLMSTLRRGVEVGVSRHEELRHEIRDELARARLDLSAMKKELHDKIEEAVLAFHLPKFEGALHSLREANERHMKAVDEHKQRLHYAIDGVGAGDATAEAKTMHSQLPAPFRKELQQCTHEQLLSMIDVLSWEPGVPAAVGRALHATAPTRTQQVFNAPRM